MLEVFQEQSREHFRTGCVGHKDISTNLLRGRCHRAHENTIANTQSQIWFKLKKPAHMPSFLRYQNSHYSMAGLQQSHDLDVSMHMRDDRKHGHPSLKPLDQRYLQAHTGT